MSDHYFEQAEAVAAAKGLVVVAPAANELFIDIDSSSDLDIFYVNMPQLGRLITGFRRAPSPSGKADREHITVTLSRAVKDVYERISLQSLLGSDRLHEALSWKNANTGSKTPTVFFEKPAVLKA